MNDQPNQPENTTETDNTQVTTPTPVSPQPHIPDAAKWYVVHTYSGHENKVATALKQRVETMGLKDKIFDVVVPTRNVVVVRHGKKEEILEKIFPGYILVQMILDDASWLCVRTTTGVSLPKIETNTLTLPFS